jgi:hypothetical protein
MIEVDMVILLYSDTKPMNKFTLVRIAQKVTTGLASGDKTTSEPNRATLRENAFIFVIIDTPLGLN